MTAQYNGTSFGIHETSEGENHFVAQSDKTFGSTNAYPTVGPVVFTRIHYNPPAGIAEFLVIKNISGQLVDLFHPVVTDSSWEINGIGFTFPQNTSLAAGEEVFLTETIPSFFRTTHGIDASTKVFQYTGVLQNSGELLEIVAPDNPDTVLGIISMPMVIIDAVRYNDRSPWPLSPDGGGDHLKRTVNSDYGNDPANWMASSGSIVAVESAVFEPDHSIFPNPVSDFLEVSFTTFKGTQMIAYNSAGNMVLQERIKSPQTTIDMRKWKSGIYLFEWTDAAGNTLVERVVKVDQ